jgi:hypothetical protein
MSNEDDSTAGKFSPRRAELLALRSNVHATLVAGLASLREVIAAGEVGGRDLAVVVGILIDKVP